MMTTLDEPPADCLFFLSPNIYARAYTYHISRRDFSKTVKLVDGLYDGLGGKQLYPPGSYFTIMGEKMVHRAHSVIRDGVPSRVYLFHNQDERMSGMSGLKRIIALVCDRDGMTRPLTADDVNLFAQLVARWAVEDGLVVPSYQGIDFAPELS